jgi:ubiquinone/menaquinone biosynthesis C-methylase UbiE
MWDRWVENGKSYTQPLSHEQFLKYKEQDLEIALTIGKSVPKSWFERLPGNKILGLACGGGQQGPILAAHGYEVTVMDFSEKQLKGDRLVAKRENLEIKTVRSDMTEDFPFENSSFDGIFCPVSNCFIDSLEKTWRECQRVFKTKGLMMGG